MSDRPRMNMRSLRARLLACAVVDRLGARFDHPQDALEELTELFSDLGVEVLTDEDRLACGLPPRGPDGWTEYEIEAMEKRRLAVLGMPTSRSGPN